MKRTFKTLLSDRRGLALITVVGTLALATILLMAIFSVTQTEYKATQGFAAAQSAKQLADTATAIVQAQIKNGQNMTASVARTTHATQPGMVRVYTNTGSFKEAYKLYSSSKMKETLETNLALDIAPLNWDQSPARYVDMNQPVVRPPLGAAARPAVYFPIIDPRAYYNFLGSQTPAAGVATTQVEGFSYTAGAVNGVVLPTAAAGDETVLRLPMPVEWIYLLEDGTMGTLGADNRFVSATAGRVPTVDNPIVGRIAFWTDDESCKINVNTASEPTFAGVPYYFHERDRRWAHFPAASSEYQRYPGHPATTALSAVLFPGYRLDPWLPDTGLTKDDVIAIKEQIYDLAPKVESGGSMSGSRPFGTDAFSAANGELLAEPIDATASRKERLFASVDEMLFRDGAFDANNGRFASNVQANGRNIFDHDVLERSRFFLTANSRAPEFSIHGLPRIAMWPIADETQTDEKRSNFDNLIALCATLRGTKAGAAIDNSYIFRRSAANSSTYDVTGTTTGYPTADGLKRNTKLLEYLEREMSTLSFPRTSPLGPALNGRNNFVEKYGANNVRQLVVSMFDYVRCINLYDGILSRSNNGMAANGQSGATLYTTADSMLYKTFTKPRITPAATASMDAGKSDDTGIVPGHGTVTPALWTQAGVNYKGFGRFITLSEVGLQFICSADGFNEKDPEFPTSKHYPVDMNGKTPARRGGQSAERLSTAPASPEEDNATAYANMEMPTDKKARWWSNFPPLTMNGPPPDEIMTYYGVNDSQIYHPTNNPVHPSRHIGFVPANWNLSLEDNKPLEDYEKRVQAILQLESFCPSLGWTKFYPEFTIVVDGDFASKIEVNGQKIFNTVGDIPIKSDGNIFEDGGNGILPLGGSAGADSLYANRKCRAPGGNLKMGNDPSYETSLPNKHSGLANMNLVSDFITVRRDQPMDIKFPNEPMQITIWDTHDITNPSRRPVQIINIKFPASLTAPTPKLVGTDDPGYAKFSTGIDGNGNRYHNRRREGPHWWCFNYGGVINRMKNGVINPRYRKNGSAPYFISNPQFLSEAELISDLTQRTRGRLDLNRTELNAPPLADGIGYGGTISVVPDSVSDVVRTMIPAMGDYRMLAAMYNVPETMWQPHPSWDQPTIRVVHNYSRHSNDVSGSRIIRNKTSGVVRNVLVAEVSYPADGSKDGRMPDLPNDPNVSKIANAYGDFDTGIGNARDGAYINKPDEGNYFIGNTSRGNQTRNYRAGYFYDSWKQTDDWRSGVFMTPNRMISSPVLMGSLPTAVWPVGPTGVKGSGASAGVDAATSYQPWQTLLFRAYVPNTSLANGAQASHPGERNPMDHYLLDLFFMPVVEPYAISEPLSEAGKINMNYQIMPFSYIRRATGMHAIMKGEFMTAIPNTNTDFVKAKEFKPGASTDWTTPPPFYSEADNKYWHRPIDAARTLQQFDERFSFNNGVVAAQRGLFRSASQICETFLIPVTRLNAGDTAYTATHFDAATPALRKTAVENFWKAHAITGENVRERPYSNLYSRLTTRSNTFRVHMRTQVIKKARSTAPDTFDVAKDTVLGEYRGSTVVERYIDPSDTSKPIPDYAASSTPLALPPLDTFYQFRTLETKRFAP